MTTEKRRGELDNLRDHIFEIVARRAHEQNVPAEELWITAFLLAGAFVEKMDYRHILKTMTSDDIKDLKALNEAFKEAERMKRVRLEMEEKKMDPVPPLEPVKNKVH